MFFLMFYFSGNNLAFQEARELSSKDFTSFYRLSGINLVQKYKQWSFQNILSVRKPIFSLFPQTAIICSKLTIETLEQGVKYV